MSKVKKLLFLFFIFNLILIFPVLLFAAESISITTYYPSPYGTYNELRTYSNTYLATDSGFVGIGTTDPGAKLDITYTGAAVGDDKGLHITNTMPNQDRLLEITGGTGISAGSYLIYGEGDTLPAESFVVRGDGNLGIGTTNPGAKLEIAGQYFSAAYALTDAATIAVDWNNANVQGVRLGGNRTITFSNQKNGAIYTLLINQDASPPRTLNWSGNWKWPGAVTPTLSTTANAVDILTFVSDGTRCYNIGFAADVR